MELLNITIGGVKDIEVSRWYTDDHVTLFIDTPECYYDVTVSILGVPLVNFWNDSYGVEGSPVWVENDADSVLSYAVLNVCDDAGDVVTDPDIINAVTKAVNEYDFSEVNEAVAELILEEIKSDYNDYDNW